MILKGPGSNYGERRLDSIECHLVPPVEIYYERKHPAKPDRPLVLSPTRLNTS